MKMKTALRITDNVGDHLYTITHEGVTVLRIDEGSRELPFDAETYEDVLASFVHLYWWQMAEDSDVQGRDRAQYV